LNLVILQPEYWWAHRECSLPRVGVLFTEEGVPLMTTYIYYRPLEGALRQHRGSTEGALREFQGTKGSSEAASRSIAWQCEGASSGSLKRLLPTRLRLLAFSIRKCGYLLLCTASCCLNASAMRTGRITSISGST